MENNIFSSNYNEKLLFSYNPLILIDSFQFYNFEKFNNPQLIDALNSYILKIRSLKKSNPQFIALLCEEIKYRNFNSSSLFEETRYDYSCVNLTNWYYLIDNKSLRRFK